MKHRILVLALACAACSGGHLPDATNADSIEAVVQTAPGENGNRGSVAVLHAADHRFGCLYYAHIVPRDGTVAASGDALPVSWKADVNIEACQDLDGHYTARRVAYTFDGNEPLNDGDSVVLRPAH
jgi:hypothetical protein